MTMIDPGVSALPAAPAAPPEIFQQLGLITRQLHDTLEQLGVMPKLQQAADGLPDARSRLGYVARKSGEAADKVLDAVDQAKSAHAAIGSATRTMAQAIAADPAQAVAGGALTDFVAEVEAARGSIDRHLTDIMLAQDFHDLTGQVVTKVVALVSALEDSLVRLLVQAAPPEQVQKVDASVLAGPVIDPTGRSDVVSDQGEVDDLLASLGF